jgi:hypothetical protein
MEGASLITEAVEGPEATVSSTTINSHCMVSLGGNSETLLKNLFFPQIAVTLLETTFP